MPAALLLLALACASPEGPARRAAVAEPPPPPPTARVSPTVDELPANALAFDVEWSRAMRLGPHRAAVLDPQGDEVPDALALVAWDGPVVRLRLGLAPLAPGGPYRLRVAGFEAADGGLPEPFEHPFFVLPPDTRGPDARAVIAWGKPAPGTVEPLRVVFPEPMRADVLRSVTALAGPAPMRGEWALAASQAEATFTPSEPWPDAPVRVSVGGGAVDLAGNALAGGAPGMLVPQVRVGP